MFYLVYMRESMAHRRKVSKSILQFIFMLCGVFSFSQSVKPYINYTAANGLASSEVYHSIQDKKGFMWFATDRGVMRYDGYNFETFTTDDGLNSNVVFELLEDEKGRIWFLDHHNSLSYYDNNEIYSYQFNEIIKNQRFKGFLLSFYVDKFDTVYLGGYQQLVKITRNGEVEKINSKTEHLEYYSLEVNKRHISFRHSNGKPEVVKNIFHIGKVNFEFLPKKNNLKKFKIVEDEKYIYIIMGYYLIVYNKKERTYDLHEFENPCVSLALYDSKIYVGLLRDGLKEFIYENNKLVLKNQSFFNQTVSSVTYDNQGGFWVTTTQRGIYYAPTSFVNVINKREGLLQDYIYQIQKNGKDMLVSFGEYYQVLRNDSVKKTEKVKKLYYHNELDKLFLEINEKKIFKAGEIIIDPKEKYIIPTKELDGFQVKYANNNLYLFSSHFGFKVYDEKIVRLVTMLSENIKDYIIVGDEIWLATSDGLGKYISKNTIGFEEESLYNYHTVAIDKTKKFDLVWATRGAGIVFKKRDSIFNVSKENGLLTNQFNNLRVDPQGNIWAGSNLGLYRFNGDNPLKYDYFSAQLGLPSNEITDIEYLDNKIYVATKEGLGILDLEKYKKNTIPPELHIKSVAIDEEKLVFPKGEQKVPVNASLLVIEYVGIDYQSLGNVRYKYKLEGIHDDWIYTEDTKFQLINLPIRGTYTFKVLSQNAAGYWNKVPNEITLKFTPPFYQTIWFYITSGISVLAIIFALIVKRLQIRMQRETLGRRLAELENKALQSQMNPHFIFNAMNGIQGLISSGDTLNSERYLANFSTLLRASLQDSREISIPLRREIDNIRTFLELETLRFEDKFSYEIIIEEALELDFIHIPPMIIQPFVENAVVHGISHIQTTGVIKIEFRDNKTELFCVIEDNGRGRNETKKEKHQSLGTKIVKERLSLLGIKNIENAIVYEDLMNEAGDLIGTRVRLIVPILNN